MELFIVSSVAAFLFYSKLETRQNGIFVVLFKLNKKTHELYPILMGVAVLNFESEQSATGGTKSDTVTNEHVNIDCIKKVA